ncbi:MAG: hypothetical protein ABIP93_04775 [Gemmatimonadaceae bacterium]
MYAGHAAIALALKARDPRVPIVPLALASFGPDWVELALMLPRPRAGMGIYTHSIPAVIVGAMLAAGLYTAFKRPGARMILLAWLLHWPADLLTGRKPLILETPLVGLDLYNLPLADFALESAVVVIGCAIYARRFGARAEVRRTIVMLAAALIVLQGAVDVALSVMRSSEWTPSLALRGRQAQLSCRRVVSGHQSSACILHFSARTSPAREQWRGPTDPGG